MRFCGAEIGGHDDAGHHCENASKIIHFRLLYVLVHTIIHAKRHTYTRYRSKGVDMPHTNRPYKSSYRYRRYCHFPRISFSFSLCAYMIAFFRCRFGKETSAAQYPPVRNLEALPLMRYNNCWQLFIPLDLSRFLPGFARNRKTWRIIPQ
mgnify:CR=1 FL=1